MSAIPNGSNHHHHHHHHHHQQQQQQQQTSANGGHGTATSSSSSSNSSTNSSRSSSSLNQSSNSNSVVAVNAATVNAHLVWPIVIRPLLCKIQKRSQFAAVTLLNALGKAENGEPGFLLELITRLLQHHHSQQYHQQNQQQGNSHSADSQQQLSAQFRINMTESLLRLQANIPEIEEQRCRRLDEPFQELNRKTFALKKILSRIPDEIDDRKVFLETIKEIASAIKKLLDCVNEITAGGFLSSYMDKRAVEGRKREFIKDSKNFSQTLKEFFKGGHEQAVFQSAAQLIYATNSIQKTIKSRCDQKN